MPLSQFHPVVARWFAETLGTPTPAQRQGWEAIRARRDTLIAAPTGSGKTLAAFLTALDDLFQEGLRAPLPDEVRVVYVSPLKALSADIHKNLAEPRRGIRHIAESMGLGAPRITAAVRTGDTTQSERAAMLRTPPHILVTTPESLYLLLTAERSREMLRTAHTVIVDEIHAVIGTRRGAHLALTLERLQEAAAAPLVRLGLSATQKPIEEVARFLTGASRVNGAVRGTNASASLSNGSGRDSRGSEACDPGRAALPCAIVDEGHRRALDLGLEVPRSALDAVMAHEVWEEYYERLTVLIAEHDTTLVFVNTRRMAERLARHLSERLGEAAVTAHHGSLSKEKRLDAETRLKGGQLKALVATASLELGIDIGSVDLVCQIGSPRRIATLLQRVGRSGHSVSGLPKGRLFPTTRDDLIECAALLRSVRQGELDAIVNYDAPLDVLAQQMVAEAACQEYAEDDLFALVRRAWPYRDLARSDFDAIVTMTADGFATKRGRSAALLHRDEVNGRVRGRRGARLRALTSGGAIPEIADYRVLLEPEDTFVGTLNEDFAIESNAGDVFQLGNAAWRILRVGSGVVRVADAGGAPPTIPFWLGEAPARSDELSRAVSDLRIEIERRLARNGAPPGDDTAVDVPTFDSRREAGEVEVERLEHASAASAPAASEPAASGQAANEQAAMAWLIAEAGLPAAAAEQAIAYLAEGRRALGVLPTQDTLVLERFFDESGGMQLVLHAPFGSRINKAWGLALRKRFCRQFNFELQAAATDDALLLSLGPQHSFPLADVFRYLHPATARDVLVQAFLDAPVFQTRWRWNTTISLAVPRYRGGRKVPPPLQRMLADDLMAAVFPDAAACLENIPGDRQIPDHPLVAQTVRDCLEEAMDFEGLTQVLGRIHAGGIRCVSRDTPEPSTLSHEILNARPYAFLDDAPLEERRAHAVQSRRAGDPGSGADDLGALDAAAIDRVRDEARPDPRDADELHDVLLTAGFLTADELTSASAGSSASSIEGEAATPSSPSSASPPSPSGLFDRLIATRRATKLIVDTSSSAAPSSSSRSPSSSASVGVGRGDDHHSRPCELWVAAERLPELLAVHPTATRTPLVEPPASRTARTWTREEAIVELLRGRLALTGPITAGALAASLGIAESDADAALLALESEGVVLRGAFTPGTRVREWCDRRLLARIHRYTLHRLRAEIEPVSPADFMRFLFDWQHVDHAARLTGPDGLRAVIQTLDGFELAAGAWERTVLPARLDKYESSMLDMLCLTGDVGWAKLSTTPGTATATAAPSTSASTGARARFAGARSGAAPDVEPSGGTGDDAPLSSARLVAATPVALFLCDHREAWQTLRVSADALPPRVALPPRGATPRGAGDAREASDEHVTPAGTSAGAIGDVSRRVLDLLRTRGALFVREIAAACGEDETATRSALAELAAAGLVASDGFAGLRGLIQPPPRTRGAALRERDARADPAGRWSALRSDDSAAAREAAAECQAWALLRRYGVVFRRLLAREANALPWRELTRIYRRLEARGEIRGGRFVSGMSGEQFALGEAVDRLREVRRTSPHGRLQCISAADPLNLAGIVTAGDRVRAVGTSRIVYRDGVPLASMEGDYMRPLADISPELAGEVASTLAGRRVPPVLSGYIGRTG